MRIGGRNYGDGTASAPRPVETRDNSNALSFAKVFGYMFLGLAITAGVSFLFGYIFAQWINNAGSSAESGISIILAISSIALIIMTFVIQFVLLKGKHSVAVPALIYIVLMGLMLSTFTMFIDWRLLGMAFGITSVIFGLLALIGALSKGRMTGLSMIILGLFMGAGIVALFSWIFVLIMPGVAANMIWILNFAIFAAVMLSVVVDVNNVKKISEQGMMSDNLALYFAFTLYVDFIYIYIKIVYFLILIFGRNR